MDVSTVSLTGQKSSVWSMLYLGVLGLLLVAGFSGNNQPTWAQSNAPTVINIGTTVQQPVTKRLGMNISGQTYWDSGQMLRDMTFNNPGFEAEQWQSILTCSAVSGNTCTDGNGWSQWPANFLQGGTYEFIYGKSKGQSGTLVSMTGSGATPSSSGQGNWYNFGSVNPAVGDVFIIRKNVPGSPDAGWWPSTSGGATISADTSDISPNSPGKQAVSLNAGQGGQSATETSYFDGDLGHSFIQLVGTYTITFRAKSTGGSDQLNVSVGRINTTKHGNVSYFNQNIALTNGWKDYSYTFNANEDGSYNGSAFLAFSVSGGNVLLDDAHLMESANANNPTAFRNAVVERLQALNPGVLRYMDSGTDFGSSFDNMIAVPEARLRAGYSQKNTQSTMVPLGLEEFLGLCEAVGAEPWFTIPMNIEPSDMQNLIQFLGGSSSTPYGAKRAALGQATPWTSVFPVIHLEIGNEMWNTSFSGEAMMTPYPYGNRAGAIFAAAKSAADYNSSNFDLVLDGQAVNPWVGQQVMNSASNNYDTIDAAPYTFNTLVDYSSNEAIFGSMFAEPEGVDSQPTGYMYQQMQMASGQQSGLTGKTAKLAVYEVSLSTLSGTASQNVLNSVVPSLGAGLSIADHMLLMMRDDGVITQNLFGLPEYATGFNNSNGGNETVALWASVVDMGGPTNCSRPMFLAEQLANTAISGAMLATSQTGNNPTWNVNSANGWGIKVNGAHYIQSFAFANGTQNSLVLFNLSRTTALPVTFTGPNAPTGLVQVGTLTSANITDNNENGPVVKIQNSTIQNFNSFGLTTLPPYSMTVYQWSNSGGVGGPQPSATSTALTANPSSVTAGQAVTLTAKVAAQSGSIPAGNVSFSDGGNSLGTAALSGGSVALNVSTLAAGSHTITATYQGSSNDGGSTSSGVVVNVAQPAVPTTTTTVQAPSQVTDGQSATFTAAVAAKSGSTPTGTVTFSAGSTVLGTASLSGGNASYTLSSVSLAAGTYSVTASYAGNSADNASTSAAATMKVTGAVSATTTTLNAPSQVTAGQSATMTASVAAASGSTPTGTVTFSAASTVLGTASLSGGNATYTISPVNLPAGTYSVTATYAGNSSDSASTSAVATVKVVGAVASTTTTVQAPSQVTDGQSATLTASVAAGSGSTPTGTITFSAGSTVLGTASLNGGNATYTISSVNLAAGTYNVTASYAGNSADSGSTSNGATMKVVAAVASTSTILRVPTQATDGQSATLSATVSAGAGAVPNGTVTFTVGQTVVGTATLNGGTASYTMSPVSIPAGTYFVTASYAGNSSDNASTSPQKTLKINGDVVGTTTTLVLSANKVRAGASMTATATVQASKGATPSGTVNFYVGSMLVGTAQLSGGKAVFTTNADLAPGTYQASVNYEGTSTDSASSSANAQFTVEADAVASTTTLTSSTNNTATGNPITLTASVASQTKGVTATGAVTFYLGQTALGTGQLAGGQAVYQINARLAPGTYQLDAVYAGDSANLTSTSNSVALTVTPVVDGTNISLTAAATQLSAGESTMLTATVTAQGTHGTPTGNVVFYLGRTQVASTPLTGGIAQYTFAANMAPGSYQVKAVYQGTSQDSASSSAPLTITIAQSVVATTTSLISSASQVRQGQAFSLKAVVTPTGGTVAPTGSVSFYLGQTQIGTSPVGGGGIALLSVNNTFAAGNYQLTAVYSGDSNDNKSTSAPLTLTVGLNNIATTTSLVSSAAQITQAQGFSLTATVAAAGGTTPQGTVSFYVGQTQIGTATLNNGSATLNAANSFAPGTYQLSAVYGGSTGYSGSNSTPITLTVAPNVLSTTTALTTSASQVVQGSPFTLTAVVAPNGGTSAPQGTVSFFMGQTQIGIAVLNGGQAVLSPINSFAPGNYQLTASYAGNAQDSASTSSPIPFAVIGVVQTAPQTFPTSTVISVNPQTAVTGQAISLQVQVSAAGSTTPVAGTVSLYMGATSIGSANVVAGSASVQIQAPAAGTYTVVAAYAGQGQYLASQSSAVTFTVQGESATVPVVPPPAPSGSFTIGLSTNTLKLTQTQTASLQVMLGAVQGYNGTVQLSCAGLPAGYSCSFSPSAVTIAGGNTSSTLSLSATVNTAYSSPIMTNVARVMVLPWDIFGLLGSAFGRRRFKGRWTRFAVLGMVVFGATFWMTGCGLTINNVTQPYQVTVTAASQNQAAQTSTFTLYVTQPAAIF